jgi:phosphatidylinositol alpha-mannosyltransferase
VGKVKQSRMKIALVSPYDFAYPGGVANHISALEHQFTRIGHDVKVIAPASKVVPDFGDKFIPIGKPRPIPASGSIIRVTISLRLASIIKAVLDQENFDIIHLHEPFMPMLCSAVLRFSNTANVGTFHACHGKPGYNWGKPISTWMIRRRVHKLHGRIAVSKPAMEFASKYVPGYYNIIPNGIDLDHFSPDVLPIDEFCDGKVNILFVGRLEKRKGVNYLLKAFKRVKQEFSNSRLIIVGPGTRLRGKYEKHVKRSGLKDVVFIGHVSYDELPRYYRTADIFCAPATGRESFGIILLEAMATGRPIVASNIEGYASLITNGVEGLLVPPRDKESLAQALITLMASQSLRQEMGARGRVKADDYGWEHIAKRVLNCYVRLLSEPPWQRRFPEFEAMSTSV